MDSTMCNLDTYTPRQLLILRMALSQLAMTSHAGQDIADIAGLLASVSEHLDP